MKRDLDLCRDILFLMESAAIDEETSTDRFADTLTRKADEVAFNTVLMADAGLIYIQEMATLDASVSYDIERLSWAGCEFLDSVRDRDRWQEVQLIANRAKNWTFTTLSHAATAIAMKKLQSMI